MSFRRWFQEEERPAATRGMRSKAAAACLFGLTFATACGALEPDALPAGSGKTSASDSWIAVIAAPEAGVSSEAAAATLGRLAAQALRPRLAPLALMSSAWYEEAPRWLRPELVSLPQSPHAIAIFNARKAIGALTFLPGISEAPSLAGRRAVGEALGSLPGVAWVEPDEEHPLGLLSQPPRTVPSLHDGGADAEVPLPQGSQFEPWLRIKLDKARDYVKKSGIAYRSVNVAVLDTGVDSAHPDLKDQMFDNPLEKSGIAGVDDDGNGYVDDLHGADMTLEAGQKDKGPDPDPGWADLGGPGALCPFAPGPDARSCGHGTHVAGIIAAKPRADAMTQGVCESCRILSLRVTRRLVADGFEYDGPITDSAQIRALAYVLQMRDPENPTRLLTNVVNMSLGKYFRSRTLAYLLRQLNEHNVLVVAAAGNDDTDTPSYPAAYSSVISVCALGSDGDNYRIPFHRGKFGKAVFSNFGDWVDICAPGTDILSTVPSDGEISARETRSGTSQATPFVAGSLGFLLSIAKGGSVNDAGEVLRYLLDGADSASVYSAPYNKNAYETRLRDGYVLRSLGAGIIDLHNSALLSQGDPAGRKSSSGGSTQTRVEGCVLNAAAIPNGGASTSLPVLGAQAWLLLRLVGRSRSSTSRKKS